MQNKSNSHIGEIIRITDKYTVIINAGNDKVKIGDQIQVYLMGEPLYNLDGSELCRYEYIKDELEVVQTDIYYSVCKKNKVIEKKFSIPLSPMLEHSFYEKESLKVNNDEIKTLPDIDTTIHVGDLVKKLSWQIKYMVVRWFSTEMVVVDMTREGPSYHLGERRVFFCHYAKYNLW